MKKTRVEINKNVQTENPEEVEKSEIKENMKVDIQAQKSDSAKPQTEQRATEIPNTISGINDGKRRSYILSGSILLTVGLLLFIGCFVWTFIADSTIELTRLERAIPLIVMFVSLVPMLIGISLIVIANKKWKSHSKNLESVSSQDKHDIRPKKYPKKNRNPRLGEIAYWRVDETSPEENTPFDYAEVSLKENKRNINEK